MGYPKMSNEEFVDKTKKLLNSIYKNYVDCWYDRVLDQTDFELSPFNVYSGCGSFEKMEDTICADDTFLGIINCDIISD